MIIFITGGARSGKSSYAQKRAKELSECPAYVATARHWDGDFEKRIKRHQQDRGSEWKSYEVEKYISKLSFTEKTVMIDCVTLWLTNFFVDHDQDIDKSLAEFKQEINHVETANATFIIVSNEIGMGVHAETETGRKFVDLHGWANQYVAERADEVFLMVSGIPLKVKPSN
jgi:adenosylcobinamide kinase/adenosylcobinamide-phosphate guanylyltransferase